MRRLLKRIIRRLFPGRYAQGGDVQAHKDRGNIRIIIR
jgi:hypothetical protein